MSIGKLSPLQERILLRLADIEPRWTLTEGGALAGFHTHHRVTRDLDLFFRAQTSLGSVVAEVREQLERAGLEVAVLRTSPMFSQLDVRDASESVVVDLVADPTPIAESPRVIELGETTILVDTPHQLLVNKLCALLSRSELRDLIVFGVSGSGSKQCVYSGVGAVTSSATATLTAPTTPGTYYVWVTPQWQYSCADALNASSTGYAVGRLEVY